MNALSKLNVYDLASAGVAICIPLKYLSDKLLFSKDRKELSTDRRTSLQAQVNALAEKLSYHKRLSLIEMHGKPAFALDAFGKLTIAINTEYFREEKPLQEFILAHRVAELKRKDWIVSCLFSAAIGLIANVALKILFPQLPPSSFSGYDVGSNDISFVISIISLGIFYRFRNTTTEKEAFKACSDAGREAVISNLREQLYTNLEYRNAANISKITQLWRKFLITESGDYRFNLSQPSISTRLYYFTAIHRPVNSLVQQITSDSTLQELQTILEERRRQLSDIGERMRVIEHVVQQYNRTLVSLTEEVENRLRIGNNRVFV